MKRRMFMLFLECSFCCMLLTVIALAARQSVVTESKFIKNATSVTGTYRDGVIVADSFTYAATIYGADKLQDYGEYVIIRVRNNLGCDKSVKYTRNGSYTSKTYSWGLGSKYAKVNVEYSNGGKNEMTILKK